MAAKSLDPKATLLDEVVALLDPELPADERSMCEDFIRRYYRAVSADDLLERGAHELFHSAMSHWRFAEKRKPKTPNVRVYNPVPLKDGWESTHTIVELVNDDMPFLVDSLSMV